MRSVAKRRNETRRSKTRWLEYLLLIVGLVAIDYTIWINIDSQVYQVYDEWKFERALHGDSTSIARFVVDPSGLRRIVGLGSAPARLPEGKNPAAGPGQQAQKSPGHKRNRDE